MASQAEPKKSSLFRTLVLLLLGALVGGVVDYMAVVQPARQKATKAEVQLQATVNTLVKLGQERVCSAKTFDEAVGVESLARDTLRDVNIQFPEDARQAIELCAEKLRHTSVEGSSKPVHRKISKKK